MYLIYLIIAEGSVYAFRAFFFYEAIFFIGSKKINIFPFLPIGGGFFIGGIMKSKEFFDVRMMAEAGVMMAMSFVLFYFKVYQMPQSGALTIGSMIPLIIFTIRWGLARGFIVCALFGLLTLFTDNTVVHPIQFILDYPLPYGVVALGGISFMKNKKNFWGYAPFIILGFVLRMTSHILSGVVFFKKFTPPGKTPLIYSLTYNLGYLVPEMLITLVLLFLIWEPIEKVIVRQN